jgi:hypothetical protein
MLSVHVELLARAAWLRIHARHVLIPRISLVFTCRTPSLCSQDQHDGVQTDVEALLHVCFHIAAAAQLRGALADCSLLRCGARTRTAAASMLSVHVELLARAAWLRMHARHVLILRVSLIITCRAPSLLAGPA